MEVQIEERMDERCVLGGMGIDMDGQTDGRTDGSTDGREMFARRGGE